MWPFRTKHVVHVDVAANVPTANRPESRVATFELADQAQNPFYFTPKSFQYSDTITEHIMGKLPVSFSETAKKRTLIKVWRDDDTRASTGLEKVITGAMNLALWVQLAFVIGIVVAGSTLPQETVEEYFPGAALAAVAANAAFFLGNFSVRSSKLGEPFEYTRKQQKVTYGVLLASILLNTAVLLQFPAYLLPPELTQLADNIQRAVGTAGLVATVIGAGISGAFDTFKWVLIEEVQRQSKAARKGVDLVERRVPV